MLFKNVAFDHSTQQSSDGLHKIYLKGEVGSSSELDRREDIFKIISENKLVDTNWAPTKNIYTPPSFPQGLLLSTAK